MTQDRNRLRKTYSFFRQQPIPVVFASGGGGGGGEGQFWYSTTLNSIYTTGSVVIPGGLSGVDSPYDLGSDTFFFVSGSIGETSNKKVSVFGGDVFVSGSIKSVTGLSGSLTRLLDGTSYLIAGSNITITTASNGSVTISSSGSGTEPTFSSDIVVSLSGSKTLGRYVNGDTIPANGLTARQVIQLLAAEPLVPTVSLVGSNPITSAFNLTSLTGSLTGSYTINSLGASVSTSQLQWKSGSAANWEVLSTSTTNPLEFDHKLDVPSFFTDTINYQYIVTDTLGAFATGSLTITPQAYAAPTATLSVAATSPGSVTGESNSVREKGNVASTITGTITRNRANVPITSYSVQYQVNGTGAWTDVPGLSSVVVSGNPPSVSIPSTSHNDAGLVGSNSLVYRVQIVDSFQTTNTASTTITFYNVIFYGPVSAVPSDSAGVRAITNKIFTNGSNPFTLNTGTTLKDFTVAMPATLSLSSVIDLDALNANLTSNYILSTFNVNDAGGTATSYKVYTLSNAVPYSSNHRHQVTRA